MAARPDYVEILRQEVESVVSAEGWSKDAIDKMHKVDSFLKECQRFYSIASSEYFYLFVLIVESI